MITVGVDLASQSASTALAVVDWSLAAPRVARVEVGVDDELIVESARDANIVAIASPFSWPDAFFEFIKAHREGELADPREVATTSGRDHIMYRLTERRVREFLGVKLIPVTANMQAATALRCAGLLARLRDERHSVGRDGLGNIVEVHPPASLHSWGLAETGYKTKSVARTKILEQIARRLPLDLGKYRSLCADNDDALDALLAALTGRAVAMGNWVKPVSEEEVEHARTEGWICLPTGTIENLR